MSIIIDKTKNVYYNRHRYDGHLYGELAQVEAKVNELLNYTNDKAK